MIGFGTKLYALPRVSYGPGERIFGNALALFAAVFIFPQILPNLGGGLAPPFMEIQDGNSKFSSGHPIVVRKR